MEKSHKKNIYVKGSKYPLPDIDHIELTEECSIIIDLDVYNFSNLDFFIDNSPYESSSYTLAQTSKNLFHLDKNYNKFPSNFDGLKFAGLTKTKNINKLNFEALKVFPIPLSLGEKKIVFLDRDGVINIDTGYPHKANKLIMNDKIIPSLISAQESGYEFIVITNQSGIARGLFSEDDYQRCRSHINQYLRNKGISILDWFHCPYLVNGELEQFSHASIFRKPLPGMILKACEKHQIDITNSIMIGDKPSDDILLPYLKFKKINPSHSEFFV